MPAGAVGCGHGASTVVLAGAYPNSRFVGYDYHAPSIEVARAAAAAAGVSSRVSFEVADASKIVGPFDLIGFFDCWHGTADPLGAAQAARAALADGGAVLAVEPFANDRLEDNFTPLGGSATASLPWPASRARSAMEAPVSGPWPGRLAPGSCSPRPVSAVSAALRRLR